MKPTFSRYQVFVIALLAFLQFSVVLDFMILSPLGALLLQELGVSTARFGAVVSAYAFSAGAAGLLAAGFADHFDRKRLLLFFYAGFILGTLLCALATGYHFLLLARVVTGLFGGVIGSISFAIVADLFEWKVRGRVMGFIQTAFSASQVLGIPLGLMLSNRWGWHAPFFMIAGISVAVWAVVLVFLKPVDAHLRGRERQHPLGHLWGVASHPQYLTAFGATILLATGGFMMMPFGSTFAVNNLGISLAALPMVYMVTGLSQLLVGPLLGRLSDRLGKYPLFVAGSLAGTAMVLYYTGLGRSSLAWVMAANVLLFVTITARMIPAMALGSAVPEPAQRGTYMSISASLQQLSGGVASFVAGLIVVQAPDGRLLHYQTLGMVVGGTMLLSALLMARVNRIVAHRLASRAAAPAWPEEPVV
jgi:predicted MFS family arabinose efflux permease